MAQAGGISVVVPVFNAFEELQRCLASLRDNVSEANQVIIIDDASTDERVIPWVEEFVGPPGPRWRFVRQPRNRGFVETANLGMRLTSGDIVLLNSDTEVTPGWLDRLADCLDSDESIATCTPWSNNGEIVSIPKFCTPNPAPQDPSAVARAMFEFAKENGGPGHPDLPTAVGFCMGISRRAIEAIGFFDAAHFGKGYGEENDFSMRARQQGFRNVLCDDAYVVHQGGRSFGPIGMRPDEDSMRRLVERHPDYPAEIEQFIRLDPLQELRSRLLAWVEQAGLSFA